MSPRAQSTRGSSRASGGRSLIIAIALAAVTAGCSTAGSTRTNTSTSSVARTTAGRSGCGSQTGVGSTTLNLMVDGRLRVVIVHVPDGYGGNKHVPLVVNMHGSGSTASQEEQLSGMDGTSDEDGFIVAYPQGLISSGSGFDWNVPNEPLVGGSLPPPDAANDVAFLTDLVPTLAKRYCIDTSRVYATGISGGGRMASQLACDAAGTFAAIAPVAGLRYPDPCPATRQVPVIAFHGTADPVDPYDGNGQAYWTYSVPTAAQRWATHDQCAPTPASRTGSGFTLTDYSGCSDASSVELYSLVGEGHEWPGGPALPRAVTKVLGPQSNSVDANTTMWSFFSAHPLA